MDWADSKRGRCLVSCRPTRQVTESVRAHLRSRVPYRSRRQGNTPLLSEENAEELRMAPSLLALCVLVQSVAANSTRIRSTSLEMAAHCGSVAAEISTRRRPTRFQMSTSSQSALCVLFAECRRKFRQGQGLRAPLVQRHHCRFLASVLLYTSEISARSRPMSSYNDRDITIGLCVSVDEHSSKF